jgi:hypothetical protein
MQLVHAHSKLQIAACDSILWPVGCILALTQSILTVWVGTEHGQYAHLVVMRTFASCIDASQWPLAQSFRGYTTQAGFVMLFWRAASEPRIVYCDVASRARGGMGRRTA